MSHQLLFIICLISATAAPLSWSADHVTDLKAPAKVPAGNELDPCEDMWAYACNQLKATGKSPEDELVATADRALEFLSKTAKPEKISSIRQSFPLPFYELSWSKTLQNLQSELKRNPQEAHEKIRDYFSENERLPWQLDWENITERYGLQGLLLETMEDKKIRSSSKRKAAVAARLLDGLYEKMPTEIYRAFAEQLVSADLMLRTVPAVFEAAAAQNEGFSSSLTEIFPVHEKTMAEADLETVKAYTAQISPLHRTLFDEERMPNFSLAWPPETLKIGTKTSGPWPKVFLAGNDQCFPDEAKIGMVRVRLAPHRYFRVLAHEYGHAVDFRGKGEELNSFHRNLKQCLASALLPNPTGDNQMKEALADWYSVETFARYLKQSPLSTAEKRQAIIEASVFSCDGTVLSSKLGRLFSPNHPHSQARTNHIFMAHPEIRKLMGCTGIGHRIQYCPVPTEK